jgi:iron complex outermembrane receptor protein
MIETRRSSFTVLCLTTLLVLLAVTAAPACAQTGRGAGAVRFDLIGTVVDSEGAPVSGARVLAVEAQRSVLTGEDGGFSLQGLPAGTQTLEIRRLGYRTSLVTVELPRSGLLRVTLVESPLALEPLNVTVARGPLDASSSPLATATLDEAKMDREVSISLAQTLEQLAGVRNLSTGQEIGKPVIRGLSGARVLVLSDGIRLEDYAWSNEDGPAVDAAMADRIEVIRGPASVLYGANAVGGVVNVISAPLPEAVDGERFVRGEVESHFASNNRETGLLLRGEGAGGPWGWRATVTGRLAEALHTPEGELENTGFGAVNAEAAAVRRASWGSLTARFTHHGGEFKLLEEDAPAGGPELEEEGPERKLNDERLQLHANVPLGDKRLEARVQGQLHHIIEMEDDPNALPERVEVEIFNLTLTTGLGEVLLHHSLGAGSEGTVGVTGTLQSSTTDGIIPIIPGADRQSGGLFVVERLTRGPWTLMGAARGDVSGVETDDAPKRAFGAVTWSAGASWRAADGVYVSGNLGRSWRAPTLFELYASGPRIGEGRYEIGRGDLDEERSIDVDLGVRWSRGRFHGLLSAYRNDFDGFIFPQPTAQIIDGYQVFRHEQAEAVLTGGEASLEVEPSPWISLSARGEYTRGTNTTRDEPLPLIPPLRIVGGAEIHAARSGAERWSYLGVEVEHVAAPDRLNPYDTDVDAYTLLHASAGIRGMLLGRSMRLDLTGHNLLDESYRDFLSRYKRFALDPGRSVILRWRVSL